MDIRAVVVLVGALLTGCSAQDRTSVQQAEPAASTRPPGVRFDSAIAAGGRVAPGESLKNPYDGNAGVARTGAALFTSMNCDGCHGGGAVGWVGPNLADGRWRYGGSDSEVFTSIFYGRPRGMPAFGGTLGSDGIWQLVTYLRSLPVPPGEATESWSN